MNPVARPWLAGAVLWAVLAMPPVQHALESMMTLQMLVQIPLLALAGWLLASGTPEWLARRLADWNHHGISGLLLASLAGMVWMLPRAMDAALDDPRFAVAKFLSVPLLIGAPVALSWPRAGFVVRGVFLVEAVATALRLGWLYLISPERLCSNYLLGDQQLLGKLLLAVGFAVVLFVGWKLMWGRVDARPAKQEEPRTGKA
ncbi:MAG TPA: hypothetical protein VFP92_11210 [Rhodanobacteraceae bacterium]|nr:hypothetical protein [Rhodanobacteraceae bacterium]